MKKIKTLILGLALPFAISAQLSETFDGQTLTSGVGSLPGGWTQYNVDGHTPASGLSWIGTNAWVSAALQSGDTVAASISWYAPVAASDDWMVTPQVTIPSGSAYLLFEAMAPDGNYPDGFQVKLSTTGNQVADFTTNLLTVSAAPQEFTTYAIDMSAYAGQQVYLAWRNNSNDMFILYIDDINLMTLPALDVALTNINMNRFTMVNNLVPVSGTIKNMGSTPITSVTIDWNDGGANNTFNATGLNIPPFGTYDFNHSVNFGSANADEFDITVNLSNPNGGSETNTANNSGSTKVSTLSSLPYKRVLVEEGTGTWCGWCPRGAVAMDALTTAHPDDFIGIAVHNGDPMTVTAYDNGANFSGYPGCNVDRIMLDQGVSEGEFTSYYTTRKAAISPASMGGHSTLNTTTGEMTIVASATFKTRVSSEMRLAAIIVEDDVTGTGSGYNQVNYYAGGAQGPMGGYESLADPVPAADMHYNHVGRALLGGYDGQAGSVPAFVNDGQVASYTFNYTVPSTSDQDQIKVVILLIDATTGEVYNAAEMEANGTVGIVENTAKANINMSVFPNPIVSNSSFNVSFNLEETDNASLTVTTLEGKTIFNNRLGKVSGEQNLSVNTNGWAAGAYLVTVATSKASYTKNITVGK